MIQLWLCTSFYKDAIFASKLLKSKRKRGGYFFYVPSVISQPSLQLLEKTKVRCVFVVELRVRGPFYLLISGVADRNKVQAISSSHIQATREPEVGRKIVKSQKTASGCLQTSFEIAFLPPLKQSSFLEGTLQFCFLYSGNIILYAQQTLGRGNLHDSFNKAHYKGQWLWIF